MGSTIWQVKHSIKDSCHLTITTLTRSSKFMMTFYFGKSQE